MLAEKEKFLDDV